MYVQELFRRLLVPVARYPDLVYIFSSGRHVHYSARFLFATAQVVHIYTMRFEPAGVPQATWCPLRSCTDSKLFLPIALAVSLRRQASARGRVTCRVWCWRCVPITSPPLSPLSDCPNCPTHLIIYHVNRINPGFNSNGSCLLYTSPSPRD